MTVFGGSDRNLVFCSLALIASLTSSTASVIMIHIIRKMQWSGHLSLIYTMTWFQLLYDISFFPGIVNTNNSSLQILSNLAQILGGISSSIMSNFIAFVALYVIAKVVTLNIPKYYFIIVAFSVLPAFVVGVVYLTGEAQYHQHPKLAELAVLDLYYYVRLSSILLNFIFSFFTFYCINRINSHKKSKSSAEKAIGTLAMRLFYYPIVQAISRSGCAWYEYSYGVEWQSGGGGFSLNPPHVSSLQFTSQCLMVISTPLASIGYLAIFLVMQPDAYACLVALITCKPFVWSGAVKEETLLSSADFEYPERPSLDDNRISLIDNNYETDTLYDED